MSGSLDGDGVDHAVGNRLNKVIVGVDKGSKAFCNQANFQPDPKVGIKVRLDCT